MKTTLVLIDLFVLIGFVSMVFASVIAKDWQQATFWELSYLSFMIWNYIKDKKE